MSSIKSIISSIYPAGVPLAWLQLVNSPKRLATALAGVAFATSLMMFQLGIYESVEEQVVRPIIKMDADLFMTSRQYQNFSDNMPFTRHRLQQSLAIPGVLSASPLYIDSAGIKNPDNMLVKQIMVIGIDPSDNVFNDAEICGKMELLKNHETVLFDRNSNPIYGSLAAIVEKDGHAWTEIENIRVKIKDLFSIGATFQSDGHVIASDELFFRIFKSQRSTNLPNIGAIRIEKGGDAAKIREDIISRLPLDIQVFTKDEFIAKEQKFWMSVTPVGFLVSSGAIVAMIIGSLVVYQILYSDVNTHIKEYAVLKAVGLPNSFFSKLIIEESIIVMILGFIPGLLISAGLYYYSREAADMPMHMSASKLAVVSISTFVSCVVSGMLATRELRTADPAEVF